ncbi:hypothetical protein Z517_09376 [Fonsecaea pedrosoi CBS 271.37]|uniref:Unplaced genomic scaffold supercont1.6, whole genome shotgun sequence n=1 Tax=Fonsecaea pedrosoi CBS 271.37 TaxID=1442368 RepID=A0A0D2ERR1_9EURO|nr:uncharacterized protein Z517_09376 [Fonsecaea pedrosoi CBS 271.37]KIW76932.1 hypothetical protein Z517_09376 [Fonsecaea pedrosoi CBS 271.37]
MAKKVANQSKQMPGAAELEVQVERASESSSLVRLEDRIILSMAETACREGRRRVQIERASQLPGSPRTAAAAAASAGVLAAAAAAAAPTTAVPAATCRPPSALSGSAAAWWWQG